MRWFISLIMVLVFVSSAATQPPPARVAVTRVFEKELAPTTVLVGIVVFDQNAGLSSEISGLIDSHQMAEGAVVRKGQVLVRLNTDFLLKDIAVIDQQIVQADIKIQKSHKNLTRFKTLFQQDATSEREYDDLAFELKELQVEMETLKVTRAKKKLELDKSQIRAPFDGLVLERYKSQGEWISPGAPICRLASLDEVVVQVALSEDLMPFVKVGQNLNLTITAMDKALQGNVKAVVPNVDLKSKTFDIKIGIEYEQGLFQNMSTRVNVPSGQTRRLKMIKRDALVRFQGKEFVYTVKEGKAKILPIQVAAVDGEFLGVEAPHIEADMPIVIDGNERLRPDQAVQIVENHGKATAPDTSGK